MSWYYSQSQAVSRKVWTEVAEAITRLDQESQRIEEQDELDRELSEVAAWGELANSISSTEIS